MSDSPKTVAPTDTFRLGLTLAGAVSAGAYSAGVLDFLREALNAWEAAKAKGKEVPRHQVQIQAISGTSAGAMCAAMFVGSLGQKVERVNSPAPVKAPSGNPLYEAWVNQVDIAPMLDDDDLLEGGSVKSILNCRILDRIAQETLPADTGSTFELPGWVANDAELFLCTTSLRGIPYNVYPYLNSTDPYAMNLHAGVMKFRLSNTATVEADAIPLYRGAPGANWDALRVSALASGAFPFALKARITETPAGMLLGRRWEIPEEGCMRLSRDNELEPVLQDFSTFSAVCVDGGAINNEPVEHVRLALQRKNSVDPYNNIERLPRELDKTTAATILIDPFPDIDQAPPGYKTEDDLFSVLKALLPSIMNQLRFKADELVLAAKVGVGSRYMISPSRLPDANGVSPAPNLACGELGGFLGFLDRSFRHHDYLLGRLNCQRFLLRHFYVEVPDQNDGARGLFLNTPDAYQGRAYFGDQVDEIRRQQEKKPGFNPVPVIPLMPELRSIDAAIGAPALQWPHYDRSKLDKLQHRIQNRMDAILERLLGALKVPFRAFLLSGFAKLLRIHPAVKIAEKARSTITSALDKAHL